MELSWWNECWGCRHACWGCRHASACGVFYDAGDAAQLVMYLSSMTKPWVQPLAQRKPNMTVHTRNPRIQEAEAKGSRYQAWKLAQEGRHLLGKCQAQSSDPRNPGKSQVDMPPACDCNTRERKSKIPLQWRPWLKIQSGEQLRKTPNLKFSPSHTCIHMCTYTHIWTCICKNNSGLSLTVAGPYRLPEGGCKKERSQRT